MPSSLHEFVVCSLQLHNGRAYIVNLGHATVHDDSHQNNFLSPLAWLFQSIYGDLLADQRPPVLQLTMNACSWRVLHFVITAQ
jgi:hypothetical protein